MADVTSNLIAHWKFDNDAGVDSSGSTNTHNLTINGATFVNDKDGGTLKALSHDGVNDTVKTSSIHADFDLAANRDITVAMWLKPQLNVTNYYMRPWTTSGTEGWYFTLRTDGKTQVLIRESSTNNIYVSTAVLTANVWQHYAVVLDRDNDVKVYIDGVANSFGDVSAHAAKEITSNATSDIGVGEQIMDEYRFYHRALAQADIDQLAYSLEGGPIPVARRTNKIGGVDKKSVISASGVDPDNIKSINGIV